MAPALSELLDRAAAVLADLHEADLDGAADETLSDAVLSMQRLRGAVDAAEARVLARWDAQKVWQPSGAKTAAAWLAWKQQVPIGVARQRIRHARAMRTHPAIEKAWAAGDIDRSHVTTLLGARTTRTREAFDNGGHEHLLGIALTFGFVPFKAACDRWSMIVDPDGAEQGADADRAARDVHLSQSFGGMWFGKMTFDPISGEIVNGTLREIERELFEADWAEAKVRLGHEPTILDLARTPGQRRADAMVEMATRAATRSPSASRSTTSTTTPRAARPPKTTGKVAAASTTAGSTSTPTAATTPTPTQPSPTADAAGRASQVPGRHPLPGGLPPRASSV